MTINGVDYWGYFKYVCRHKWLVFKVCRERGLLWRGIVHDMSKFLPDEFLPYAAYFYGPRSATRTQNDAEKRRSRRRGSCITPAMLIIGITG